MSAGLSDNFCPLLTTFGPDIIGFEGDRRDARRVDSSPSQGGFTKIHGHRHHLVCSNLLSYVTWANVSTSQLPSRIPQHVGGITEKTLGPNPQLGSRHVQSRNIHLRFHFFDPATSGDRCQIRLCNLQTRSLANDRYGCTPLSSPKILLTPTPRSIGAGNLFFQIFPDWSRPGAQEDHGGECCVSKRGRSLEPDPTMGRSRGL